MGNSLEISTCFNASQREDNVTSQCDHNFQKEPITETGGGLEKVVRFSEPTTQQFATLHLENPDSPEADDQTRNIWDRRVQSPYPRDSGKRALDEKSFDSFLSSLDDISRNIPKDDSVSPKSKLVASKSPRRSKAKKSPRFSVSPKEINRISNSTSPEKSNSTSPTKSPISTSGLTIVFTEEVYTTVKYPAKPPKSLPPFSPAVQQRVVLQSGNDTKVPKKDCKKKKSLRSLFGKLVKAIK